MGKKRTSIGSRKAGSPSIIRKVTRGNRPKHDTAKKIDNSSVRILGRAPSRIFRSDGAKNTRLGSLGKSKTSDMKGAERLAEISRKHKSINLRVVDRLRPGSRKKKVVPENRTTIINTNVINDAGKVGDTRVDSVGSVSSSYVGHRDHHPPVRRIHRYEHVYWDHHRRLCHRIVWPRYYFPVCYSYGPYFTFRYVYPYYLRRYVFVSLGGYWPIGYRCIRYYWYGYHPYRWYGYYPIGYEVKGDTYNYYTYNYYYDDDDTVASAPSQVADGIRPVDHTTFADVREKLAQQKTEEPEPETLADTYFDEAVKAFEAGNFDMAIEKFAKAMELAPDDMVLPFAYSQALFANEQYRQAAKVLREALAKVSPEKEAVFYPRGLYSDDDVLFEQIERLTQKAKLYSFDADLQLLLGYQLLGIGEIDKAVEPLQQASQDLENADAATILLDLLAKIKTDTETENS
ncbi:MAG: tetratricopeptide repeat protein, partial [Sedimentisphaerales bacterium]